MSEDQFLNELRKTRPNLINCENVQTLSKFDVPRKDVKTSVSRDLCHVTRKYKNFIVYFH